MRCFDFAQPDIANKARYNKTVSIRVVRLSEVEASVDYYIFYPKSILNLVDFFTSCKTIEL